MATSGMAEAGQQMEKRNDYEGQLFIGTVVDNKDPKFIERLRVRIPNLYGDEIPDDQLPWALPQKHRGQGGAASVQTFAVPIIGAKVIVMLQNGDPYHPMYVGGLLTPEDVASIFKTNYPDRYGMRDNYGNHLYVDTKTGDIDFLHKSGFHLHITPSGTLQIEGPEDAVVQFTRNVTADIGGNFSGTVGGNADLDVGAATNITSGAVINISAPSVNIN